MYHHFLSHPYDAVYSFDGKTLYVSSEHWLRQEKLLEKFKRNPTQETALVWLHEGRNNEPLR